MNLFGVMNVSGSALGAERLRAEVTAANLANAESTRTSEGGPYQRKQVIFRSRAQGFPLMLAATSAGEASVGGVEVSHVVTDPAPPILRYEPSHPDADAKGYVAYPNINPVMEMTDLLGAVRSYELNISAVNASKQMIQQSIDILR